MSRYRFRSHNCGELRAGDIDRKVMLCGWVARVRDLGGLLFLSLRDQYGKTQIVTDSTSDLSLDVAAQLGLTVVPLNIRFGEQAFRDGLDLTTEDFYQRLTSSPKLPTTSQPSTYANIPSEKSRRRGTVSRNSPRCYR